MVKSIPIKLIFFLIALDVYMNNMSLTQFTKTDSEIQALDTSRYSIPSLYTSWLFSIPAADRQIELETYYLARDNFDNYAMAIGAFDITGIHYQLSGGSNIATSLHIPPEDYVTTISATHVVTMYDYTILSTIPTANFTFSRDKAGNFPCLLFINGNVKIALFGGELSHNYDYFVSISTFETLRTTASVPLLGLMNYLRARDPMSYFEMKKNSYI